MDTLSKFLAPAILFLLTLLFGVWLSLSGKPYNGWLFNIHKLIALAAVVLTVIPLYQLLKGSPIQVPWITWMIVAGVCVLALFFSGAMMSSGKLNYPLMLAMHRIALSMMVILVAGTVYLFTGRKI
jgi:hypothetical protein